MSPACMPGAPYVARTGARSAETGRSSIGLLHPYSPTEPEPGKASIVGPEVDKLTARLKSPKPTSATSPSTPTRPARSDIHREYPPYRSQPRRGIRRGLRHAQPLDGLRLIGGFGYTQDVVYLSARAGRETALRCWI